MSPIVEDKTADWNFVANHVAARASAYATVLEGTPREATTIWISEMKIRLRDAALAIQAIIAIRLDRSLSRADQERFESAIVRLEAALNLVGAA